MRDLFVCSALLSALVGVTLAAEADQPIELACPADSQRVKACDDSGKTGVGDGARCPAYASLHPCARIRKPCGAVKVKCKDSTSQEIAFCKPTEKPIDISICNGVDLSKFGGRGQPAFPATCEQDEQTTVEMRPDPQNPTGPQIPVVVTVTGAAATVTKECEISCKPVYREDR